jgi:hypothetical protein
VPATIDIRQAEIRRDRWRRRAERAPWPWLNRILAAYAEQAELIRIEALRRLHVEARRN